MYAATFFISTGRCGTQWLARHLDSTCGLEARVEHEPLHARYEARRLLGSFDPESLGADGEALLRHADAIEAHLERGPYFETGHPCWSALPYLAKRFKGRFCAVHLARHPLPTALSWMTLMAYAPPLLPSMRERVPLSPFDEGVAYPEYREEWARLPPFEKCLYYWAEVNAFALRQETALGVPWLRIAYEGLFEGDGLADLHAFLGIPDRAAGVARDMRVDAHRFLVPSAPDLAAAEKHPRVWEVAAKLGYGMPGPGGFLWRGHRLSGG